MGEGRRLGRHRRMGESPHEGTRSCGCRGNLGCGIDCKRLTCSRSQTTGRPLGAGSSLLLPASWGASGGCGEAGREATGGGERVCKHVDNTRPSPRLWGRWGSRCWMQLAPWWFLLHLLNYYLLPRSALFCCVKFLHPPVTKSRRNSQRPLVGRWRAWCFSFPGW